MNDPTQPPQQNNLILISALIGGFLTIAGGFIATIVNSRIQKKNEIDYIKIGLIDELYEICSIIGRMIDTHRTTHSIPNSYLNDLQGSTESFKQHKQRLFLIRNDELRREIVKFYKDLDESITESINKVGTLGDAQIDNTLTQIVTKFTNYQTTASSLKDKVKSFKYYIFWFSS